MRGEERYIVSDCALDVLQLCVGELVLVLRTQRRRPQQFSSPAARGI
jgi:hypothetical protein